MAANADAKDPFFPRAAAQQLAAYLDIFPVVVVSGARRTGKSTLVRTADPSRNWAYHTLDESATRDAAQSLPEAFLEAQRPAIIDEVQRVPDLIIAIKAIIDRDLDPPPGQYILTGSADILNHPRVTETLAGRAGYLRLGPLARQEILGNPSTGCWSDLFDTAPSQWVRLLVDRAAAAPAAWRDVVRSGGLPRIVRSASADERATRLLAYVDTYVERDLRDLANIDSLSDFRRLMRAAAIRTGNLLNAAELSRDIQVPATTIKRWLDLLEISFLLVRLEAFTVNRTSRLMKSTKLYWCDTALGLFLAGIDEPRGADLENLVLSDLLVWRERHAPRPAVMHWRSTSREVDFVVERGNRLIAVEVKATTAPAARDWRHLQAFMSEYRDMAVGALLLHAGDATTSIGDGIVAAPWWRVL